MPARTATTPLDVALLQARPLPDEGAAPDWVMLLPAGATIATVDGRGPYRVEDAEARVAWTEAGRQLLADRAYRCLSPVIRHRKDGRVTEILRAALTNTPNLRGMAALNSETDMDLQMLRALLRLKADADDAAIHAAVTALNATAARAAALPTIARAAGLKEDADGAAALQPVTVLAASGAEAGDGKDQQIKAL